MLFPSLFKTRRRPTLRRAYGPAPPARRPFVPRLESLEDRTVLSTLTVVTTADTGPGSLRDAVRRAANGDAIVFDPSLAGQAITLTSGQLEIAKNLTIAGPGADRLAVRGGASRVLGVGAGATVAISGLTIAGGRADQGAGIDNAGSLIVTDCTLSDNVAAGDSPTTGLGGGAFNEAGATLAVNRCRFVANQAAGAATGLGHGGGLENYGTATVTASAFTDNTASGGRARPLKIGAGGAISNQHGGNLTIVGSTFRGNQALDGLGIQSGGGALDNEFGASLTVTDSAFIANLASAPQTTGGNGGAIFNFQATLTVARCAFTDNRADGVQYGESGAIDNELASATVSDSTFAGNRAVGTGPGASGLGGVAYNYAASLSFTGCTFTDNQAQAKGGADGGNTFDQVLGGALVNIVSATLTLTDCNLVGNLARGGNGDSNGPMQAFGWAFGGGVFNLVSSTLTVTDSRFVGNQALAGSGNGLAPEGLGGGIDNDVGSTLRVDGSAFLGNRAVGGAGGAGTAGGTALGGGILNQFNSTATISRTLLAGNQAVGGAGGAGAAGGAGVGGGVVDGHVFPANLGPDTSALTLSDSVLVGNLAQGGAGGTGGRGGDGFAGGIWVGVLGEASTDSLTVTDSQVVANRAAGGAGGAGADGGNGEGGGLFAASGTAYLTGSTVAGNRAVGGAAGAGANRGKGIGGGLSVAALATAGGKQTHIGGNFASTEADDVFGIFNPDC